MGKNTNQNKKTGVVVPLGALYTEKNKAIGEYPDLVDFAKFCKTCGIQIIQLLPLNDTGTQSSPYSALSAFALHPIYIRIRDIAEFKPLYESNENFKKQYDTFIQKYEYTNRYDYDGILNTKIQLLKMLYEKTQAGQTGKPQEELSKFIKANDWVKIYAVYKNLKWNYMQASWKTWHDNDQHKSEEEILELWHKMAFKKEHLFYAWIQMLANNQLKQSVDQVHQMGILLKGDLPIMMNEDSCDSWAYPNIFNQNLRAGSPSDGENPTGQNWGFPTYNWKFLKENDYSWWKERLKIAERFYDAYRLDHILGFFRIWAINSADVNALNGHTDPYSSIKREELYEHAFDDDRIRWLSQPHIPTCVVEDITWNHETAHAILKKLCDQIPGEELWLFKKSVSGSAQIMAAKFGSLCTADVADRIKEKLVQCWSDRTLIEAAKNKFVPMWTYSKSTSWQTLNPTEKNILEELFAELNTKNEKNWKKQATEILTSLTGCVKMQPCGEDLGVNIACVPEVMKKLNIFGLRVVRWNRSWFEEGQPYVPFKKYDELSVTTTSVHDSSTIRQWWNEEKPSVQAFIRENYAAFEIDAAMCDESQIKLEAERISAQEFSPEIAKCIMSVSAKSNSLWYVPPLQDFLFMNKSYWLENASDERINVPGTVTKFNWTYRLPVSVEALNKDTNLIDSITDICKNR